MLPPDKPLTLPDASVDAMVASLLVQVPPVGVTDNDITAPPHIVAGPVIADGCVVTVNISVAAAPQPVL